MPAHYFLKFPRENFWRLISDVSLKEQQMARCENNIAAGAILSHLSISKSHDCLSLTNNEFSKDFLINYTKILFSLVKTVYMYLSDKSTIIISSVILVLVLYLLYKCYWRPLLYTKELTDIGYDHIPPGKDRQTRITRSQQARRLGSKIPPPYPNGWFAVAESEGLKIGGVLSVDALGQNLCVYRGQDGVARCVDTYCPHLGANLAIGGAVRGNCIECPFHKWKFGENGACVSVPGSEQAPRGVSVKTWTTVEADGAVWIWHDAEGRPPLWEMRDTPEAVRWGYRGRNEFMVSAHIQEIPENGADVAHLNAVHSPSLLSTLGETYPFLLNIIGTHIWSANWTKGDDHTASMTLTHDYKILKYNLFHIDASVTQNGPGHVRLLLHTSVGPLLVSQSVTPMAPLLQRVVHRIYSPWYDALVGSIMVMTEAYMFERDVAIWNSKIFVGAPAYVKTDKAIRAFRSWFAQFYSEGSKSFREANQNPIDW